MKAIPLRWVVLALILGAAGARAGLWTDDYEAALQQAKAESRFVLLDFTGSDWCGWCKRLEGEVFSKPSFKDFAKKNLVCVTLDFPRGHSLPKKTVEQNEALSKKFAVGGYPTIILLDPTGNKVGNTGYKAGGAESYVEHLESLIAPHREKFGPAKVAVEGAAGAAAPAAPGGSSYRTWTASSGATLVARMEQRVGNTLYLRSQDGRQIKIDVAALSAADQEFLKPAVPAVR